MNLFLRHTLPALCLGLLLATVSPIEARPAYRGVVTLLQKDGSIVKARLHGDEFAHYLTDLSGHALTKDPDGDYCYAYFTSDGIPHSTGWKAHDSKVPSSILTESSLIPLDAISKAAAEIRTATKDLREKDLLTSKHTLATKAEDEAVNKHSIVILAQFQDKEMTYTRDNFVEMLSSRGYAFSGATGSALDYFEQMFRGDYHFEFTVSPIVTLDHESSYYFGHDGDDKKDKNSARCIADACIKAHEMGVDFSLFDDDQDGKVDNVIVFVAGKDEAECGDEDCVWSHQWWVWSGARINCTLDGKQIDRYAVTTELGMVGYDPTGAQKYGFAPIGTFCHEFSHTFGLPDYYDTDGEANGGVANGLYYITDLMDGGCYNNYSRTPPHYGAVNYHLLGLGKEEPLLPGEYNLEYVSENRRYLRMETGTEGEYYLFEARGGSLWDGPIGGGGLAIYHIDRTDPERWIGNTVNIDPSHECAHLVSAYPSLEAFTDDRHLTPNIGKMVYFPYSDNDSFTSKTDPPFVFWNGEESQLSIINIKREGDRVSFKVVSSAGIVFPEVEITRKDIFQQTAILQWSPTDGKYTSTSYVSVSKGGEEPTVIEVLPYSGTKYALRLDGLEPRTAYKIEIRFGNGDVFGTKSEASFTTRNLYDSYPYIYLRDIEKNEDGSFIKGTALPLIIYNPKDMEEIRWYKDGREVHPESDGYYHIWSSGTLKAEVTYTHGDKEILQKKFFVK